MLLPITIFLGAFLLFLVQPMMGRFALPWFGGGSTVWTVCMLFFQSMLLVGYLYAHWLGARKTTKEQSGIHIVLLLISLLLLPAVPARPQASFASDPTASMLWMLFRSVGMPYFLLASTSTLLQRWFHFMNPSVAPWRLYSLSNLGSFLALFSYPFLLEPLLRLRAQANLWSVLYGVFVLLCAMVAWKIGSVEIPAKQIELQMGEPPTWSDILMWLGLSACGSLLLLATTTQITHEIAPVPFLWVAPLAIYLLTFVLSFESERWYRPIVFASLSGLMVQFACAAVSDQVSVRIGTWQQLAVCLATLFVTCMLCHGELAQWRPSPGYLTQFYLVIAAGGVLGGILAALVAPRVFNQLVEYPVALSLACVLGFLAWIKGGALSEWTSGNFAVRIPLMALVFGAVTSIVSAFSSQRPGLDHQRNFFGVLRVAESSDKNGAFRELLHGRIRHGVQYQDPAKRTLSTTYYGPHSGVALALDAFAGPRRAAFVGLGTGTLAAWGRSGDDFRFYEIDPAVEGIARRWFSFLSDSKAKTEIVLGDARLRMEQELAQGQQHDYDLIALDAFSGDAIPVHLLTAEAGDLYRQRLKPGGMLAIHISNRSLDLEPVARGLAQHLGWKARMVIVVPDLLDSNPNGEATSRWVILAENIQRFSGTKVRDTLVGWSTAKDPVIQWTDNFSSLWRVLKF